MKTKTDLVAAAFIISDNKILLIHHKKLNLWIPPGGHIEASETPDEALKREIQEELGIDIEIIGKTDIPFEGNIKEQLAVPFYIDVHSVGDHDHCCFYYLCKPKNKELKLNKEELIDFQWHSLEDLEKAHIPLNVRNQAKKALELSNKNDNLM